MRLWLKINMAALNIDALIFTADGENRHPNYLAGIFALLCVLMLALGPSPAALAGVDDADCLECHEGDLEEPFNASWHLLHSAKRAGEATACTDCHGDSEAHLEGDAPDISFGKGSETPIEKQNAACQGCHGKEQQMFWLGSVHEQEETACTDCHSVHQNEDRVATEQGQLDTCLSCHSRVQAEIRLPSRHPILEGKTSCTDCHNPHGSSTEAELVQPTLNDNCYGCHAEKRGPHLWEHAPVAEDCSVCHSSHGSVNDDLLVTRGPFLCQQCHSAAFHPSLLNSGSTAGNRSNNHNLLGKNCLNCHSQVHGSNHPSGARLTR
jgi:DmsE family decaheme c-type cytochrome